MEALLVSLTGLFAILAGLLGFQQTPAQIQTPVIATTVSSLATTTLAIGGTNIIVEIADTNATRTQGLSGRPSLDENHGMLFVFNRADYHSFWMKNMRFPLDIIWLDNNWRVIDLTENISPKNFPTTYQPHSPARYVLETNVGFIAAHSITVGPQATLH